MSPSSRPTLAASPSPASPSFKSKRKSCARKCERCCCNCIIYFPLVFVYGLTSWGVWVQATVGFAPNTSLWIGHTSALVGILLFILLNWSYTTAVFTDPGSPLTQTTSAYSIVPSADEEDQATVSPSIPHETVASSLTVKSTGEARYCKKCHTSKPDRTHHCSTCRRCVLKMDHHCPWLATCVGFRNYKPFLLFLLYTCLFCWLCFAVSFAWVWDELLNGSGSLESDRLMPVNIIILAVMAGIIGLVLSGFTGWHVYLACTGQTTIESLEKTRYLAPLRKSLQQQQQYHASNHNSRPGQPGAPPQDPRRSFASQLREIHANALPGVTRPEEGIPSPTPSQMQPTPTPNPADPTTSPAHSSLRKNLSHSPQPQPSPYTPAAEAMHERARYNAYLDDLDTSKLPNAFDLGWRSNLQHVLGPRPELWFLPVCNTTGDGWNWEPSKRWLEARAYLARERKARAREEEAFDRERFETMQGGGYGGYYNQGQGQGQGLGWNGTSGGGGRGRGRGAYPPQPPPRRYHNRVDEMRRDTHVESSASASATASEDDFDTDESDAPKESHRRQQPQSQRSAWGREAPLSSWNDIPDEFLRPGESASARGSPGPRRMQNG